MKVVRIAALILTCLISLHSNAYLITNGDFDSCDFTGWNKDTDGFGDISYGNDFEIDTSGADCRVAINVDYFDQIFSPISEAWFANTLYQDLNFAGDVGSTFELTISFDVDGESDSSDPFFLADYFLIGLNDGTGDYYNQDGNLGFLVGPTDIDGVFRNSLTFELDNSYLNESGWSLDFQLNIGWDAATGLSDAYGSTLLVNNVSMVEIQTVQVPEPSTIVMLSFSLVGLIARKKLFKRAVV